jgi:hypothetical protein
MHIKHMWNDEQVDVFCAPPVSDGPIDYVTRDDIDAVTCHACLRAAIEFGERCRERLEAVDAMRLDLARACGEFGKRGEV